MNVRKIIGLGKIEQWKKDRSKKVKWWDTVEVLFHVDRSITLQEDLCQSEG